MPLCPLVDTLGLVLSQDVGTRWTQHPAGSRCSGVGRQRGWTERESWGPASCWSPRPEALALSSCSTLGSTRSREPRGWGPQPHRHVQEGARQEAAGLSRGLCGKAGRVPELPATRVSSGVSRPGTRAGTVAEPLPLGDSGLSRGPHGSWSSWSRLCSTEADAGKQSRPAS